METKRDVGKRILAIICMAALLISDMPANVWASSFDASSIQEQGVSEDAEQEGAEPEAGNPEVEDPDMESSERAEEEPEDPRKGASESKADTSDLNADMKQYIVGISEVEPDDEPGNEIASYIDILQIEGTESPEEELVGAAGEAYVELSVKKLDTKTGTEEPVGDDVLVLKDEPVILACDVSCDQSISNVEFTWVSSNNLVYTEPASESGNGVVAVMPQKGMSGGEDLLAVTVQYTEADGLTVRQIETQVKLDVWTVHDVTASIDVSYATEKSGDDAHAEVGDTLEAVFEADGQLFDEDFTPYKIQWQKQDEIKSEEVEYVSIEQATQAKYIPERKGMYRICVTTSDDSASHMAGGTWFSEPVEVFPVAVSVQLPQQELAYNTGSNYIYSAEAVITRVDTENVVDDLKETVETTLKLGNEGAGADAGTYVGKLERTGDLNQYQYEIYGEEDKLYGTLELVLNPYAYEIQSISDITLVINPVTIEVDITVPNKVFDNTNVLLKKPEISWKENVLPVTSELVIWKDGKTHAISKEDFVYESCGDVDANTEAGLRLADTSSELRFIVNGDVSGNYLVHANYISAVIKKLSLSAGKTVSVTSSYVDSKKQQWYKPDENGVARVEAEALESYQIAGEINGEYGKTAVATIGEEEQASVFVKNKKNQIARVTIKNLKVDGTAPSVTRVNTKKLIFNNKEVKETYSISDNGSGVKDIYYLVSEEGDLEKIQFDPETWSKVEDAAVQKVEYSIEIKKPKFGYVYLYVLDNVGNADINQFNMLVLEDKKPAQAKFSFGTDVTKPLVQQKVSVSVSDDTADGIASGIQSIEYKLTDSEKKDVTGDAKITVALGDGLIESENYIINREQIPENLEQVKEALSMSAKFAIAANGLLNGTYVFTVTAYDLCGNSSSTSSTIRLDGIAPRASITKGKAVPYDGKYYYNASNSGFKVTIKDENISEGGKYLINVESSGTGKSISRSLKKNNINGEQGTIELTTEQIKALGDGEITVTVEAKDMAGNVTESLEVEQEDSKSDGVQVDGNQARFILDTLSPKIVNVKTVMREKGANSLDSQNMIVFYSKPFDTTVTIEDENIGIETLSASPGDLKKKGTGEDRKNSNDDNDGSGGEERSEAPEITDRESKAEISWEKIENGLTITYSVTQPGLYNTFEISGTDYAGNALTVKQNKDNHKYDKWSAKKDDDGLIVGGISKYRKEYETPDITAEITYYKQKENKGKITEEILEECHRREVSASSDGDLDGDPDGNTDGVPDEEIRGYYNRTAVVQVVFRNLSEDKLSRVSVRMDKSGTNTSYVLLENLPSKGKAGEFSLVKSNKEQETYILRYLCEEDGEYRLFVMGEHASGEPITVNEKDVSGIEKHDVTVKDVTSKKPYMARDLIIVDKEAPVLSLADISSEKSSNQKLSDKKYGSRYYYNSDYVAKFVIKERYLDKYAKTIGIYRSQISKATDTSVVEFKDEKPFVDQAVQNAEVKRIFLDAEKGLEFDEANAQVDFVDPIRQPEDVSKEGVYDYLIFGEDIAGNTLVKKDGINNIEKSVAVRDSGLLNNEGIVLSNTTEGFLTNAIVVDRTAPIGKIEILSTKDSDLRYVQTGNAVSVSKQYISDRKAIVSVMDGGYVDEKTGEARGEVSPYRISYELRLKNGKKLEQCRDTEFALAHILKYTVSGRQIFSVGDIRIEDLAGNVSSEMLETQKIYLDQDIESDQDTLAPSVAVSPTIFTEQYGNQGQALFNASTAANLKFNVAIYDPFGPSTGTSVEEQSSSGLAEVSYGIYSVGHKMSAEEIKKKVEKGKLDQFVLLSEETLPWTPGILYHSPDNAAALEDKYVKDGAINVPKALNQNDLMLLVKARDNAGNEKRVHYLFGIDRIAPEITLSYDNQSVKNEKYFKENRSATIIVRDRNFDPALISVVKTTSKPDFSNMTEEVETEWKYSKGNAANGDDDTWECKVEFAEDGNYELHVYGEDGEENSISDRAGNKATLDLKNQKAPNRFVIDKTAPEVCIQMGQMADSEDGHYYYRADNCGIEVIYTDHGFNMAEKGNDKEAPRYTVNIDGSQEKEYKLDGGERIDTVRLSYLADEVSENFADGDHSVFVEAVDLAGNSAEAVVTKKGSEIVSRGCEFDGLAGSFILDKTAPKVIAISTVSSKNSVITDNKVYRDTSSVYYNQDIRVVWNVADEHVKEADFKGGITRNGKSEEKASAQKDKDGLQFTFSLVANNAYAKMFVSGEDKAGNRLVLDAGYAHNQASKVDDLRDQRNGMISAVNGKVVDKESPVIRISYRSEDNANLYNGELGNQVSAYYNKNITAQYRITDNYELDGKKIWVGQANAEKGGKWFVRNPVIPEADDQASKDYQDISYQMTVEGRYSFTGYGTDRALNPVLVEEMRPRTDANPADTFEKTVEAATGFTSKYVLFLDKTKPVFVLDVKSPESKNKGKSGQGNRYYFNSGYTATATIKETNYDYRRITFLRGSVTTGSYNSETEVVGRYGEKVSSTSKVFRDEVTNNGVFRYAIYGSDKAGNALVAEKNTYLDGKDKDVVKVSEENERGSNERQADTSNHIVVDTVSPAGRIDIRNGQTALYTMLTNGNVTFSEPYRREQEANILFTVDSSVERSPVRMTYSVDSTVEGLSQNGDTVDYQYGRSVSIDQNGRQQFKVASYVITDLAGNETVASSNNYIYLDAEIPTEDTLAPTISVVANAPGGVRSGQGQPLFNSNVPIRIIVTDPYGGISSSGLAEIQYDMYVNGERVPGDTEMLHGPNTKTHNQNYEDEELSFQYDGTVTVDAGSHNYNDLRAMVTVADNSGNISSAEYSFGIDVTSPDIDVTYDNNDAQKGKYFKADRTATVVVTERNFDPSRIIISTESAASIGGWSHVSGGSANGDDDTWTGTISYTVDGDYHLSISGEDLLGNPANGVRYNGVAPTDFVLDKTAPRISISYDNNDVRNLKYYKADRTATVTVNDVNFDGANDIVVNADVADRAPAVTFDGKTCTLPFMKDGIYRITGTVTDMAGNVSGMIDEPEFVLDKTRPVLSIEGVKDLSANQKPVRIILKMLDTNVNETGISAVIKGTNHGDLKIGGKTKLIANGVQYTVDRITKDDYYTLEFVGTDLAGNEVVQKISFSENQHGTVFVFEQKEVEGKYTNKIFKPSFKLYNIDEVTILSVTLNGNETGYTYKDDRLELKDDLKSDGKYVITIDTKDAAGNINSMDPVEFYIDRTKPVLTVVGVDLKQKYYFEEFDITLIHDNPLDSFEKIELDGRMLGKTAYVVNRDGSITIHIGEYGEHELAATVRDAAGNTNKVEKYEFVLTKNPVIRWYSNKPLFFGTLAAASALVVGLIIFFWNRRKRSGSE